MPNPNNVVNETVQNFTDQTERDLYAAGLEMGLKFANQVVNLEHSHPEPQRVRKEYDPISKLYSAYIENGRYDKYGKINWD